MISFSITSLEQNNQPYAVFGGYNTAQIVGGYGGLHFEKVKSNHLNTWALEGQALNYGGSMVAEGGQYVAIIDTGSSQIALPPGIFEGLKALWKKAIPEIDCSGHEVFCFVDKACKDVA
jgi:hypothetical protein